MAKRRYKRDRRGRFTANGSSHAKRVSKKLNRKRPRYIRGSAAKTVRVGRVGPGGEYTGIHVGARLHGRQSGGEYYIGVSAGKRIASHSPY